MKQTIKYIGIAVAAGVVTTLQLLLLAIVDHRQFGRTISGINKALSEGVE